MISENLPVHIIHPYLTNAAHQATVDTVALQNAVCIIIYYTLGNIYIYIYPKF